MNNFLKSFLASLLAITVALGGMMFISFMFLLGIASTMMSTKTTTTPSKNTILHLDFTTIVTDAPMENPMDFLDFSTFEMKPPMSCTDILTAIDCATIDPDIKAIYMEQSYNMPLDMAQLDEVRSALLRFKESGKKIYSYNSNYTQKSYLLASVADCIYLNPEGSMEWKGMSSSVMFFKDMLDKFDIKMEIFKYGTYKSAIEPFMTNQMSDASREQTTRLLNNIWGGVVSQIAKSRDIDSTSLQSMADELSITTANCAQKFNLVDKICYKNAVMEDLKSTYGSYNTITLSNYIPLAIQNRKTLNDKQIAVIYAEGEISGDISSYGIIGYSTICRQIAEARDNSKVKAVVIRVNSPGGSALASDIIDNEIKACRAKKPVIISMGGTAASGGYYMSCSADAIVASPYTITGSIGVFGMMPQIGESLKKNVGITFDVVKTNQYADMGSPMRPMTSQEREFMQKSVDRVYSTFVNKVAEGRKMSFNEVDSVAQGRVWSGVDALELGLVDVLGGLQDAIYTAATHADIVDDFTIKYPHQKDDFVSVMMSLLSAESLKTNFARLMSTGKGEIYTKIERETKRIERIINKDNIQALMPYTIEIK